MLNFIKSFVTIFTGLAVGYLIQKLSQAGKIKTSKNLLKERRFLQKTALLVLNPITFIGAIWIIKWSNLRILALPFLGMIAILLGGLLAFIFAKAQKLSRIQTGSYIVSGGFTNMGSLGGLLVFFFLGEGAFALVPFYKLFEEFCYYGIGFPIAKSYSDSTDAVADKKAFSIFSVLKDPFFIVAMVAIVIGLVFNFSGIERPSFYIPLNNILIPVASFTLLVSIGMAMRFSSVKTYLKPAMFIALIKFLLVPIVVTGLALLLNFSNIDGGIPLKVVIILSAMPSGFLSLVVPTVYKLDLDLSNASWLLTNIGLFAISPILYLIVQLF